MLEHLNFIPVAGHTLRLPAYVFGLFHEDHLNGFKPVARYGYLRRPEGGSALRWGGARTRPVHWLAVEVDYLLLEKDGAYYVERAAGDQPARTIDRPLAPVHIEDVYLPEVVERFFAVQIEYMTRKGG